MSQTPACPDVPDDVRALARSIATSAADRQFSSQWYALRRAATDAILADRASRALPSTALAARPEEGWQIKPLDWYSPRGSMRYQSDTPFGGYWIERDNVVAWCLCTLIDDEASETYPTLDAAKAAAQADYETRIRSALVAPSTPPTAGDGHD